MASTPPRAPASPSPHPYVPPTGELLLYGGTFDPPHLGHLLIVEQAEQALGTAHTLIIPTRQNPLKTHAPTSGWHRGELCRLAFGAPHRTIDTAEIEDAGGASYTIDTVRRVLAQRDPAAPAPWLLIGADAAAQLPQWRETEDLQRLVRLAVATRPGTDAMTPPHTARWISADADVSSTQVRQALATGSADVTDVLSPDVLAWIREHELYRTAL